MTQTGQTSRASEKSPLRLRRRTGRSTCLEEPPRTIFNVFRAGMGLLTPPFRAGTDRAHGRVQPRARAPHARMGLGRGTGDRQWASGWQADMPGRYPALQGASASWRTSAVREEEGRGGAQLSSAIHIIIKQIIHSFHQTSIRPTDNNKTENINTFLLETLFLY